ncbi:gelsolin-related protein of 125 kDa-like [Magallana gigas]|uniref:gelsolin-related protein of 125 kDa-like n=1 Tax=Magallana gigas TaxID=29159 RepID=UPI00333FC270
MESKSDIGNGPGINMERVPITEGREIQRSDDNRANGIGNGETQRRVKNIPVLEERRLLALERHIKRKRRRRPYVKKMKISDKTEHQLGKTMTATNEKMPEDPGAFNSKVEGLQVFEGKEKEVRSHNEVEGTEMVVYNKYEKKQTDLQATNEMIENFAVQSTKMDVARDQQQDAQFDKLIEYVLDIVKSEIADKVEEGLKSQSEVKQSEAEEGKIKKDEGTGIEVKQERGEKFTYMKEVNTIPPEYARQVNDEDSKKEKENFQDEGHLERAKDNDNKIVEIGDENAEQSSKTSSSGSIEPKPKDPELEAAKTLTSQLIKHEARNKLAREDDDDDDDDYDDDDDDDDDGFMPRKLFFFSFSEFKKEVISA